MASQAPPGWYDDGSGRERWWDGTRWTGEYIDLRDGIVELRTDDGPAVDGVADPGWYDDHHGRERWWDGRSWTSAVRYSGQEKEFAGVVLDGRWVHFGERSLRVGDIAAEWQRGPTVLRRADVKQAATGGRLFGPTGPITPRTLPRTLAGDRSFVVVTARHEVWIAPGPAGFDVDSEVEARRFVASLSRTAEHYRFG